MSLVNSHQSVVAKRAETFEETIVLGILTSIRPAPALTVTKDKDGKPLAQPLTKSNIRVVTDNGQVFDLPILDNRVMWNGVRQTAASGTKVVLTIRKGVVAKDSKNFKKGDEILNAVRLEFSANNSDSRISYAAQCGTHIVLEN